jgi:hypothetical protein
MRSKTTMTSLLYTLSLLALVILFVFFKNDAIHIARTIFAAFLWGIILLVLAKDLYFTYQPKDQVSATILYDETDEKQSLKTTTYTYEYRGKTCTYACSESEMKQRLNQPQVTLDILKKNPTHVRIHPTECQWKQYLILMGIFLVLSFILYMGIERILA